MISNSFKGRLGTDFGTILGSKMNPKSVQNRSQERSWHKNTHSRFDPQKQIVFAHFSISRRSKSDQQSTKNHLKSDLKFRYQKNTQKCPKKWPTWLQHGLKLGPCWAPKSSWTRPRAKKKRHRKRQRKKDPKNRKKNPPTSPPTAGPGQSATPLSPWTPSLF